MVGMKFQLKQTPCPVNKTLGEAKIEAKKGKDRRAEGRMEGALRKVRLCPCDLGHLSVPLWDSVSRVYSSGSWG